MTEALLFVSVCSLLTVGAATLAIAALTLRNARRYVELAEERVEHLREEHARLLAFLLEEHLSMRGEEDRVRHPERERTELRTYLDAERRIDDLRRELLELRKAQPNREAAHSSSSILLAGLFEDTSRPSKPVREEARRAERMPPTASPAAESPPPGDTRPRLAVWHPHPDDDVSPGRASAGQSGASATPVEMFRRHYDKYLENYEGYVKLAERIYQTRCNAEAAPGSLGQREWEERLRRVNDGIRRTTARLDILEEYNPSLATDDRISRRASIARVHSELEING